MATNTTKHISDWADSVKLDVTNTPFGSGVTNVQSALDALGSHALDGQLPIATTGQEGILYLATQTDIDNGTDPNKAVTPALLAYALNEPYATESVVGWTRYATNTEALNDTFNSAAATPKSIHHVFEQRNATELDFGTIKLSSSSQAVSATNNTTATTPLRVKEMIDTFTDTVASASESVSGIVELATVTEVSNGVVRDGMAISPYAFTRANATESSFGTARIATQTETNALASDTRVVTPAKLGGLNASTTQKGFVELATDIEASSFTATNKVLTPSNLNSLNASTTQKGFVELATDIEADNLTATDKVLTPASLNAVRANGNDPSKYGIVRLSNYIESTSTTSGASSYAVKRVNDRVDNTRAMIHEWEVVRDYGTSRSSSHIIPVDRSELDGYEFKLIFINSEDELREFHGIYSSKFNNGNTTRIYQVGSNDGDVRYEINNQRFDLYRSENKAVLILRRRISVLETGYSYTAGGDDGGTSGGGGTGGGGGGGGGGSIRQWQQL